MATPPTDAPAKRPLRDSPLGKVGLLLLVLAAAFLVARTCGNTQPREVSQDDAIEIAREQVDYEPDRVMTRVVRRGVPARSFWAVSLQTLDADGSIDRLAVVIVDGTTGEVAEIRRQ